LRIGNQVLSHSPEDRKKKSMYWSIVDGSPVTMEFLTDDNKVYKTSFTGTWGWGKLLSKANTHNGEDSRHYELVFDLDGHAIRYMLEAKDKINPFVWEVVNNFTLGEVL
jgi:type VI protein secretion system component VasK